MEYGGFVGYIDDLFIKKEYRRLGIANCGLAALEKEFVGYIDDLFIKKEYRRLGIANC
jgi:ribosomal protein S18 acetylase RimI-like enzyme